MNRGTQVNVTAEPNGDLRISNQDGTILIRQDGTVSISTFAPIELTGASLGKIDTSQTAGTTLAPAMQGFLNLLARRGRR